MKHPVRCLTHGIFDAGDHADFVEGCPGCIEANASPWSKSLAAHHDSTMADVSDEMLRLCSCAVLAERQAVTAVDIEIGALQGPEVDRRFDAYAKEWARRDAIIANSMEVEVK